MPLLVNSLINGPQEAVFRAILTLGQMAVAVNHLPDVLAVGAGKVMLRCFGVADYLLDGLCSLLYFEAGRAIGVLTLPD